MLLAPKPLVIVVRKVVDLAAQFEDLKLPSPLHILLQRRVDGFLFGAVPAGAFRRVDKFAFDLDVGGHELILTQ